MNLKEFPLSAVPVNPVDPPDYGFWPTVRRLLGLWRRQWRLIAIAVAGAVATVLLSISIPLTVRRLINDVFEHGREDQLWVYVGLIVAFATLRFGANFMRRFATARIGIRIEAQMRELLYAAYLVFPRAFYDQHATGQVISRATNDLYPIRYFIGWGVVQGTQSAMMIIGVGIVLFVVNAKLALLTAAAMPLIGILAWLFAHKVMPISRRVQQLKADVTEASDEAVVGIEMVQAFGREDDVRARFGDKAEAVRAGTMDQATVEARFLPGLLFIPTLSIAVVLFFGGREAIAGELLVGDFVLFMMLLLQLAWPLEALGWIINLGQRAVASASRSFAWLEEVQLLPERSERHVPDGPLAVRFDDVHFRYGTGADVLRGATVEVDPGEIVAVCGPTGAGKTTLLSLLTRFYDPTSGRVLVGGVDARDVPLAELRRAVAIVTQRPILFSVPLKDNLMAARPDAPWEEVLAACEAAGVAHFAEGLPNGYDTLIGERGVNLSGGQRQRVALARALIANSRVIVLDDPLSAVDTETERFLVENLRPAVAGRTVLLSTQRLSTVEVADRAVVLIEGRIVEEGTPHELLEAGGAFARLFGDESLAA